MEKERQSKYLIGRFKLYFKNIHPKLFTISHLKNPSISNTTSDKFCFLQRFNRRMHRSLNTDLLFQVETYLQKRGLRNKSEDYRDLPSTKSTFPIARRHKGRKGHRRDE